MNLCNFVYKIKTKLFFLFYVKYKTSLSIKQQTFNLKKIFILLILKLHKLKKKIKIVKLKPKKNLLFNYYTFILSYIYVLQLSRFK